MQQFANFKLRLQAKYCTNFLNVKLTVETPVWYVRHLRDVSSMCQFKIPMKLNFLRTNQLFKEGCLI